jgi:hypothetical protein
VHTRKDVANPSPSNLPSHGSSSTQRPMCTLQHHRCTQSTQAHASTRYASKRYGPQSPLLATSTRRSRSNQLEQAASKSQHVVLQCQKLGYNTSGSMKVPDPCSVHVDILSVCLAQHGHGGPIAEIQQAVMLPPKNTRPQMHGMWVLRYNQHAPKLIAAGSWAMTLVTEAPHQPRKYPAQRTFSRNVLLMMCKFILTYEDHHVRHNAPQAKMWAPLPQQRRFE